MTQPHKIQKYLLDHISNHPHDIVGRVMKLFEVSRTTVLRHINHLIKRDLVLKTGTTRQITYSLRADQQLAVSLRINSQLDEFSIFTKYMEPQLIKFANKEAYNICEYGATEMINNAKDHSTGKCVRLSMEIKKDNVHIRITDDGIGALDNIMQTLGYDSYPELILDLSKGKLTTDPVNHTGEGVFFSSRAFDSFSLTANGYCYFIDNLVNDWSFYQVKKIRGTIIDLRIATQTKRDLVSIFKAYQDENSLAFNKTEVKVELARMHGERLISRSQAKRILRNLEQFDVIVLDFKHVVAIGQGFVDEIFRVYKSKRPEVKLEYCNTNADVAFMIERSL